MHNRNNQRKNYDSKTDEKQDKKIKIEKKGIMFITKNVLS